MKYLITESKFDSIVFKYLDNQDFIKIEKSNMIYFVNSESDEDAEVRYNKDDGWCFIYYKLVEEISTFFSLGEFDSEKVIFSPSTRVKSFLYKNEILELSSISATIAIDPLFDPTISSPIIKSEVFENCPTIDVKTAVGHDGFDVSADSNMPWTSIMSEVFNDISSSWTLVPNG